MSWWIGLNRAAFNQALAERTQVNRAEERRGVNFYSMDWGDWLGSEEKRQRRSKRAAAGWKRRCAEKRLVFGFPRKADV